MRRIAAVVTLVFFGLLVQATGSTTAQEMQSKQHEKPIGAWKTVAKDVKVLKLWETAAGPRWPEIALLQLSPERHKELEQDPLAFVRKYKIFDKVDGERGHSFLQLLGEEKAAGGADPLVAAVVHDSTTYMGYASFGVGTIKP